MFLDDFKSHSTPEVKDCIKSHKSGTQEDDDEDRHELADAHVMAGGITLKSQPIDLFLEKITKGCCRNYHDTCMLESPIVKNACNVQPY